ncbi:MAG: ABC transporter permease subunit [Clostridiales bacterium]|nr:ABC transporter permease subunit [Clostridiales bacterium]
MVNLLKADFFRLFKGKSLYICALVWAGIFVLQCILLDFSYRVSVNMDISISYPIPDALSYGITAFLGNNTIIAIFVAIFAVSEFTHGTMKNLVSKGFSKVYIFLSKFIVLTVAAYFIIFVTFIAGTACAWIFSKELGSLSGEFGKYLWGTIGIELYLRIALTALLLMVSMSIKNMAGAITINILGLSFGGMLFTLLEYLVNNKIKFTNYSLSYNIAFYSNQGATGGDYVRTLIVGAVYLAISLALGIFIFKKSDVK